jgi:hypothetical protein
VAVQRGYNLAIPNIISNSVSRAHRLAPGLCLVAGVVALWLCCGLLAHAEDWSAPEQQLARKIVAISGPGAVSLTFENRSSLGRREAEVIQNGLRSALKSAGVQPGSTGQATANVSISLSENLSSYVWVARIKPSVGDSSVLIVSVPRSAGTLASHDSVPLTLRKTSLWQQSHPFLDVLVLEESSAPTRIAVLEPERVWLYRSQGGKWQQEQGMEIAHTNPWPRDLRGRLVAANDHLLDVYLPGVLCRSQGAGVPVLSCHEAAEAWPLVNRSPNPALALQGTYETGRNYFSGAVSAIGNLVTVPPFYSAAVVVRERSSVWLFAGVDRQVHIVDGLDDRSLAVNWGSDISSVRTPCGAGSQILATSSGDGNSDSIRAYEVPDRDPIAVSQAVDMSDTISALWTEARGDTAVAITRNPETGSYEAFRVAVVCSQ